MTNSTWVSPPDLENRLAEEKEKLDKNSYKQYDALLRYHYPNIKVDELTDDEWVKLVTEMNYVLLKLNILQQKE